MILGLDYLKHTYHFLNSQITLQINIILFHFVEKTVENREGASNVAAIDHPLASSRLKFSQTRLFIASNPKSSGALGNPDHQAGLCPSLQ